jgi:hypothetical protein
MMAGMTAYVLYHAKSRYGTHFQKFGPTYLMIIASILIMADLTRHVLEDLNWWPSYVSGGWGSAEYRSDCSSETPHCLSSIGIVFTLVCTYLGFTILAIATLWNANIMDKLKDIKAEWKRLREPIDA